MPGFRSFPLLATLLLAAALPAPAQAVVGGVVQSEVYPQGGTEAEVVDSIGGKWVRMFFDWSKGQPTPPSGDDPCAGTDGNIMAKFGERLALYDAKGIGVNVQVAYAPAWANGRSGAAANDIYYPPTSAAGLTAYANFMQCLAGTFKAPASRPARVWEVWNEPNDSIFWLPAPDPVRYAALLKAGYEGAKRGDPSSRVLIGGLVGNDYDFLQKLYDNGAKPYFDGVDIHVDTACLIQGPDFYYREESGRIGRFAFSGYREVHATMGDNGDAAKPIWMEIGWSTRTEPCTVESVREQRASGVDQDTQAKFLTQAYNCLQSDPYVEAGIWFSLQDVAKSTRYDHWLGLMTAAGQPKKSFGAFQSIFKGAGPTAAACGAKLDRDKPAATIKVPSVYFSRFAVEGSATDPTTPIRKIELWVDGKRIDGMNVEGASYKKDWFGSSKLSYGKHRVELRAYDEALNVAVAAADVTRLNPAAKDAPRIAEPRVSFTARKKGKRILVDGRVLRALTGDFTEKPRGRLKIFFERKRGGKFRPYSRYTKGISRRAVISYVPRKRGTWRVHARTTLDAPYKNVRTRVFTFRF